MAELEEVYNGAGEVTDRAFKKAREAIADISEYNFTDEEIEKLLPEYLRRTFNTEK